MEFAIGTLIAFATLVVTYFAYRVSRNQSFKRLHYSSFMAPLVLSRWYDNEDTIKIRQDGEEFILPFLCAARIENTGRVPILPSDFNGPLTIRLKGMAVFRCGALTWNRTDIFDPRRPDPLAVNQERSEIAINPILLNPRDSITISYIADFIPGDWGLEVSGRIAGVEEIIKLPNQTEERSMAVRLHKQASTPLNDELVRSPNQKALTAVFVVSPVLICPDDMFTDPALKVFVDGHAVSNAHLVNCAIHNPGPPSIERNAEAVVMLKMPQSRVVKIKSLTVYDNDSDKQGHPLSPVDTVLLDGATVSICLPKLDPGGSITALFITSGDCRDMIVESKGIELAYMDITRAETDRFIEYNLAQAEPRLLLTNQTLFRLWHSLKRRLSRLKSWLKFFRTELLEFFRYVRGT